jgi:hypothetical protein
LPGHVEAGDVDDDRVTGGTTFDGEDLFDGLRVEGVGGKAVDGFGGEHHELTGTEGICGTLDGGIEQGGGVG